MHEDATGRAAARAAPSAPPVRVVVADGQPLFRAAVAGLAAGDDVIQIVGSAADGREALRLLATRRPDVLLTETRLPDMDAVTLLREIATRGATVRTLCMSDDVDGALVRGVISAGAFGYLSKTASAGDIRRAVLRVALGELVLARELCATLAAGMSRPGGAGPRLTPREQQVLDGMATGRSAPEIARQLDLALPTVKTHVRKLYAKLGVTTRGGAVAEAVRHGLVS